MVRLLVLVIRLLQKWPENVFSMIQAGSTIIILLQFVSSLHLQTENWGNGKRKTFHHNYIVIKVNHGFRSSDTLML